MRPMAGPASRPVHNGVWAHGPLGRCSARPIVPPDDPTSPARRAARTGGRHRLLADAGPIGGEAAQPLYRPGAAKHVVAHPRLPIAVTGCLDSLAGIAGTSTGATLAVVPGRRMPPEFRRGRAPCQATSTFDTPTTNVYQMILLSLCWMFASRVGREPKVVSGLWPRIPDTAPTG